VGQRPKSPIPVPPIPYLAGKRGGNPRLPIRPKSGNGDSLIPDSARIGNRESPFPDGGGPGISWSVNPGQTRKSPARRIGTPIPDSRPKSGIGDSLFPGQNRESGIPSPIPGKKSGIGADSGDPIPDYRVSPSINRTGSGLGIYSAASIMPVLSQAACGSYSGSKDVPWHQSLGRHRPKSPSHSPPSRRPSRHPPSAVLGS